jgi:hypothetical protein
MDLAVIKEFGFPLFCVLVLGYFCWGQFQRMTVKLDSMETYIRDELAEMVKESHIRERELVDIIRRPPSNCPYATPPPDQTPSPHASHNDTARIMEAVDAKHGKTPREGSRVLRGISGLP